jgi:hypothetical protein
MAAGTIESIALGVCDKRACPSSVVSDAFGVAAVLGPVVVVAASLGGLVAWRRRNRRGVT